MRSSRATDMPGVRYPSLCRPVWRHEAGCPSGQRERSVKPSAKPTQVRTLDLPPIKSQLRVCALVACGGGLVDRSTSTAVARWLSVAHVRVLIAGILVSPRWRDSSGAAEGWLRPGEVTRRRENVGPPPYHDGRAKLRRDRVAARQ